MITMAKKYEFKPDKPRTGLLGKLFLTPQQRRNLLKWALYALVLVALSVIQDVLLSRVRIFGATTELVPCGIFLICILEGTEKGSIFALISSLLYLFSGAAAGIYTVVLITVLAVLVTALRQAYLQKGFFAGLLCTALATVSYQLLTFIIGLFLGLTLWSRLGVFLLTALWSIVVSPVLYPIFLAIGGGNVWNE